MDTIARRVATAVTVAVVALVLGAPFASAAPGTCKLSATPSVADLDW